MLNPSLYRKSRSTFLVLMALMLLAAACGPATATPSPTAAAELPVVVEEVDEAVDPEATLYRMFADSSGDPDENELRITEFVGNIQIADLEAIFGDLSQLPRNENGNYVAEAITEDGIWYLNASPDGVGVNLASWAPDGTVGSAIDLDGDNQADIIDYRLPDNRRITIVTELAGLEAFELWLQGQNPLCQTELAQQLGLPDFGCDDPGEGSAGGDGGVGLGGGIIDPFDLVCAGYPTGTQAGIMAAAPTYGHVQSAYQININYRNGGDRVVITTINQTESGLFQTQRIIRDYNAEGNLIQSSFEGVVQWGDGTASGHRSTTTYDGEGNVTGRDPWRHIRVTMDENGDYNSDTANPPLNNPHENPDDIEEKSKDDWVVDGEPVPPPDDTGTQGNPGPEGDDRSVARFCANRGNTESGAEQAASTNPAALGVSCNDLVGAPSNGDCTIIEWSGAHDFSAILDAPSTDSCGEFQTPNENGECEPSNAIERLRGRIADIYSLDLPAVVLCPPIACDPNPDSVARVQQISGEAADLDFATITPIPGGDTPTETPAPDALSELLVVLLSNARCRKGPDTAYDDHDFFSEGDQTTATGRSADGSWLFVAALNNLGNCWVARTVVDVDVSDELLYTLPVILPPPTPTASSGGGNSGGGSGSAPAAPQASYDAQVCSGSNYKVNISWTDAANNEDGYRILRNGAEIALLPANSTKYTDSPPYGGPYTYTIQAYNGVGSAQDTVQDPGCLP